MLFVAKISHSIQESFVGCSRIMYKYIAKALNASLMFFAQAAPVTPNPN
jgi:hypothetical protein